MTEDPRWFSWSAAALEDAANTFRILINAVIYAEVSARYSRIEDLESALPRGIIDREAVPYEAGFLAGKAYQAYRRRGGPRRSVLPDLVPTPRWQDIGC